MLKDKKSLEIYVDEKCLELVYDKDKSKTIYDLMYDMYNIPKALTSDMISQRISLSECTEFQLFCLLTCIEKAKDVKVSVIDSYFTDSEIKTYSKTKFKRDEIEFPIIIPNLIQVSHDQWIGKTDVDFLMKLRKMQLINYNVNAQRTMQHVINGNGEHYKISLNKVAISAIKSAYEKEQFIPNTITLNIPMEIESDFYYDESTNSLVINSLEHFDISDGYHRYIAQCQIKDMKEDFNYPLEFRVINFSEDRAKQFIFQEDQKTKMRKLDSDALNMTKSANIVATRLNQDHNCNLQGLISRNEGIIPFGEFAGLIHFMYFKDLNSSKEKTQIINITKELMENFNMLTESNTKYLEEKYSFKMLCIIMYIFQLYHDKDKSSMCKLIEKSLELSDKIPTRKFYVKVARKTLVNEVANLVEEAKKYV